MSAKTRSPRRRDSRPSADSLEGRALLNGSMPSHGVDLHAPTRVVDVKHNDPANAKAGGPSGALLGTASSNGYQFIDFDGPTPGSEAGAGSNVNGISNAGTAVGFTIDDDGNFHNFTANPLRSAKFQVLNIDGSTTAMAFGINEGGVVVGTDGNGNAFSLSRGKVTTFIPTGGASATAFSINDEGTIVGQYAAGDATPGFIRVKGKTFITINAPSGPNSVNAQGINNRGQVVGFYVGNDGQDHGFMVNEGAARKGTVSLTGTAIADPTIPNVPGEPGATFVFSQILGVNDKGIAVGYYGDSTTSQHGFLYNTNTGKYTFLDDPSEAFNNGVEVTQITGITNSGEITGFYSDANGVFHGFVANPGLM
jgi:uncharacterized membrane protein